VRAQDAHKISLGGLCAGAAWLLSGCAHGFLRNENPCLAVISGLAAPATTQGTRAHRRHADAQPLTGFLVCEPLGCRIVVHCAPAHRLRVRVRAHR